MHRRRVAYVVVASLFALAACATGTSPLGGGGSAGGNDAGIIDGSSSYADPGNDSGAVRTHPDSGVTPIDDDSGTTLPVDSGTTTGTGADCSGTTSDQLGIKYSKACDNWYLNGGDSNPCTPGAGDCTTDPSGSGFTMCCYTPSSSSYCYGDFGGTSQCVPQ